MPERIMVIDDDALNLRIAEHILQRDYDVLCSDSPAQGLELMERETVDLVLIDMDMPEIDGMEVLRRIRGNDRIAETRVILLTTAGSQEDVTEAERLGALDFIRKPFFPTELLERVKKALEKKRKDRILVVDDDRMNLKMAEHMLGKKYEVSCVASGQEALETLTRSVPNLILLDLHMPQMNGLEVFEKIKQMDKVRDVPVVFLTADSERETEIEIFKAGAMDYIQKPFLAEVVIRRIDRILELYHLQRSLKDEVYKKTEELRESNRKVTNLSVQVMLTLANTIDAKDKYTRGHSVRVATYSREIARRMGKSEQEMDTVYYIGLLHDIGKIGIPDTVINKPDRLTDEEYAMLKAHPAIGADILKDMTEIPDASIGAHWHHERFDGQGYPDGLKGEEIPELARIIGVADAYDAMSSKRSYRDMLPQEVVRREIEKGRGSQFDPRIADILLDMIDEDKEYNMREK